MKAYTFTRRYSFFAPTFTYAVDHGTMGWIGEVARNDGERVWYASNKTWSGGADLDGTFPTRAAAAHALFHAATTKREG